MTNPRSKSETLSETTKTYCKEWLTEKIFNSRKDISTPQIQKGILCEDEAIDKTISWLDLPFVIKNEKFFENDYLCGTPDLIYTKLDLVIDMKCSWDEFTFPLFEDEIPTKDYYYQLQGYMHLTGMKKAKLVYVLLNTPEGLSYKIQTNYDDIDPKYRIKPFDIAYDEAVISQIEKRVIECREYINSLLK